MMAGVRTAATCAVLIACGAAMSTAGPGTVAFWMLPSLILTGIVQWKASRGDHLERARLWYAALPLWILTSLPLVLALPLGLADRAMSALGVATGAAITWARSRTQERLITALHGPPPPAGPPTPRRLDRL